MLTVAPSARNWMTLRWSPASDESVAFIALLRDLCDMPGVRGLGSGTVDVPASVWATSTWYAILDLCTGRPGGATGPALWVPKRPLYQHQVSGAAFLVAADGGLCADPMGLGKTATAIVAAESIARREAPDAARLIIAPGYTRAVWLRELLALGAITDESEFCAVKGRDSQDKSFTPLTSRWWFCHYDVAHAWASRLATNGRGRPIVAICDEAHWIKNGKASRSKGAAAAAGVAAARIMLTGTPLPNRASELWFPLTVLDGSGSWGGPIDFRRRYCGAIHDGYGYQDVQPTNTGELRERLSRRYLRRTVEQTGVDMPVLTRQVLEVEIDVVAKAAQASVVADVGGIERLLEALDRGAFGTDVLRALSRLSKLTSAAKLPSTVEHLRSLIEQGERAVVFVHERATAHAIAERLGDESFTSEPRAWVATGESPQAERDEMVRRFQAGERDVMIATYGAMREGVTLHAARCVVLHDLSWVPSDVLQAEARIHRLGQSRACISTWMLAEDSFDTLLARSFNRKATTITRVLGDTTAATAVAATGLERFEGASVEDEAQRLLTTWGIT